MEKKKYPIGPEFYILNEEVGQGVSAAVHRALCIPFDEIVAIKILDFERYNCDLNNISREVQIMILIEHPNVVKSHCSFVNDHNLWVVMPFMAGGSCLHILKAVYPDGFEEVVIATILREVLKGLEYLHHHGHIHRDVKAGNILMDSRGAIKLGDFGVSACMFDSGDRQRMRNTFVGTPCWMAPEVMEQLHGYDFKADIWSFGITALELAHGHAPFSKYPPMKVLLMTLQNAPPGLDYERDKKFSKSFKQMIASCLVKDPSKRPSAKKLLKHSFFKQARSSDYISRTLLEGLPSLGDRIKELKRKEEDMLAQKKMPDGQKEEISQNEYKRGISGWNFNLEDMKAQASLIQDVEYSLADNNLGGSSSSFVALDSLEKQLDPRHSSLGQIAEMDDNNPIQNQSTHLPLFNSSINIASDKLLNQPQNNSSLEGEDVLYEIPPKPSKLSAPNNDELDEKAKPPVVQQKGRFKVTSENVGIEKVGPIPILHKSHSMQVLDQTMTGSNVQVLHQHSIVSVPPTSDATPSTFSGHFLFPMLNSILQTNILQRDTILNLMKQVSESSANRAIDGGSTPIHINSIERSLLEASHDREKELLHDITELQWRLIRVQDELQKNRTENAQV
ncbi:serine/threonine-protein kinase BLUS1 isoform X9 [Manihot esculenta]|uniref:serine/threonine-protein kinase BLUS1 isoform X9 n=1 Tax=Manihot esculenta TaxID=3983 RepID=UPI001CC48954|nr:serine/threonine-protein kinase BLUS1 isoform X9 [Manihot esculenta]